MCISYIINRYLILEAKLSKSHIKNNFYLRKTTNQLQAKTETKKKKIERKETTAIGIVY